MRTRTTVARNYLANSPRPGRRARAQARARRTLATLVLASLAVACWQPASAALASRVHTVLGAGFTLFESMVGHGSDAADVAQSAASAGALARR